MGHRQLIERFDPQHISVAWGDGLNGLEAEASALDIV